MAYLSVLVLFCLACFAGDVVELEPVKALSFNCGRLTPSGTAVAADIETCYKSPYCVWDVNKCKDDPCLLDNNRVLLSMLDTCGTPCSARNISSTAPGPAVPELLKADCSNLTDTNTGILCITEPPAGAIKIFDYCAYAYIRDQACPDSICKTSDTDVGCVPNNIHECQMLSKKDCLLVPKCFWDNSCKQDPCYNDSEGVVCKDRIPSGGAAGDCIDFKPLKTGTTNVALHCVHKSNDKPNICYFAAHNTSVSDPYIATDYQQTYPTYNFGGLAGDLPTCTGKLTGCEGTGECVTVVNQVGALAGLYCSDGTHGRANTLRIPSVLVFLIVSALAMFVV